MFCLCILKLCSNFCKSATVLIPFFSFLGSNDLISRPVLYDKVATQSLFSLMELIVGIKEYAALMLLLLKVLIEEV